MLPRIQGDPVRLECTTTRYNARGVDGLFVIGATYEGVSGPALLEFATEGLKTELAEVERVRQVIV